MAEGSNFAPYIRANLRGMPVWNPTATLASERTGRVHRMDLNECPYPPSPSVVGAMRDFADKVNRYPDGGLPRLTARITERIGVPARYDWPIAEGFDRLVRVRRRQDAGVAEIETRYPALVANDDKPAFSASEKLAMALRDPLGFAVYTGVALSVRLRPASVDWSRGR